VRGRERGIARPRHRLRRVRNNPAPTAATAPTPAARIRRLNGAVEVMSGPLTVGAPESRAGSRSVKTVVAETAIESCANTWTTAVAPLAPLADLAWSRICTVESAGTVTPVNVGPLGAPAVVASCAAHPTAARSAGFGVA